MEPRTFLFEAVVTRFEAKNVEELDLRLLEVTLLFNNISVSITAGRINVNEIVAGFGIDFVVDPISLRSKLEEQGIQMMVCYAAEILGAGVIKLPKMFTDRIVDGMNEIMHLDSCQIENDAGKPVGSIEILIRLMIKCDENVARGNCERNTGENINPNDILFIVSEPPRPDRCDPCAGLEDQQ